LAEAVPILEEWCQTDEIGQCANYYQALALTKDARALPFLRDRFHRILSNEGLMAKADFQNWIAFDAVCCMEHMLELGQEIEPLRSAYETLRDHPDDGTREQTKLSLTESFEGASNG
jgi:hypothetical protein